MYFRPTFLINSFILKGKYYAILSDFYCIKPFPNTCVCYFSAFAFHSTLGVAAAAC